MGFHWCFSLPLLISFTFFTIHSLNVGVPRSPCVAIHFHLAVLSNFPQLHYISTDDSQIHTAAPTINPLNHPMRWISPSEHRSNAHTALFPAPLSFYIYFLFYTNLATFLITMAILYPGHSRIKIIEMSLINPFSLSPYFFSPLFWFSIFLSVPWHLSQFLVPINFFPTLPAASLKDINFESIPTT